MRCIRHGIILASTLSLVLLLATRPPHESGELSAPQVAPGVSAPTIRAVYCLAGCPTLVVYTSNGLLFAGSWTPLCGWLPDACQWVRLDLQPNWVQGANLGLDGTLFGHDLVEFFEGLDCPDCVSLPVATPVAASGMRQFLWVGASVLIVDIRP